MLYVAFPMHLVLAVDVVTAALAIATMLATRIPEIRRAEGKDQATVWRNMTEAYSYLASWRGALLIVTVFSVVNFLITPAFTFFNLLTLYHFGQGPFEVALIDIMAGFGMIAGGLTLGIWGGTRRKIVTCMGALASSGGAVMIIGFLPPGGFIIAVISTLFIGTALAMVNGTIMAILQKGIRADMQGRVFALLGSLASGMSPLGLLISGPVSDMFGIQSWFILGGAFMMIVGVVAFFVPLIMRIEDRATETVAVE
jgi:DHA3 family macrolide efflux protein-like MFS transporter